ncbi:hypothetical protein MKZ38_004587 [Zalerion maritima]|uniref:AB hydrolase-1 domain-containing protein n=1 Tax=Zalerion maritima TaxID=339359 RepID=A0AAD5S4A5_9PEZI|nr:hypothetical protein MKZ38_004587 [Zalerion maritima]
MPFKLPWDEPTPAPSKLPSLPKLPESVTSKIPEFPTVNIKLPKLPDLKLPSLPFQLTKNQQRVAIGLASCAALAIAIKALPRKPPRRTVPSPRDAVDELTSEERADLPYPPNCLPGGRDIETPYGTVHVFEWGPETGERVMLVHGISTPCISLADLGWEFARKGFRVIVFDLYSRGYSSGPDPEQQPYDARLYTTQMLSVHASMMASLPLGASPRFHLVGYSLGGTLSVSFARYYPHLVASLTLIAPSGLLRPNHLGFMGKLLYSPSSFLPVPSFLIPTFVRWRITPSLPTSPSPDDEEAASGNPASSEEASAKSGGSTFDHSPISLMRPSISVSHVVRWQIGNHPGFIPAFISTMANAPIYGPSSPDWSALADILAAQRSGRHRSRKHRSSRHSSGKDKEKDRKKDKEREKDRERRKEKERKDREKERRKSKSSSKDDGDGGSAVGVGSSSSSSSRSHRHEIPAIHGGKVLMILGSQDPVIPMDETVQDAINILGEDGVQLAIVDGGHEVAITQADEVARFIMSFLSNESLRITRGSDRGAWDTQSEASSVFSSIKSGH